MPKFTFIIPTFNSAKFIDPCLGSIFSQGDDLDFEVIIVDNNSQDGTIAVIKEKYPKTKLIQNKKNIGPAHARNQGVDASKGGYLIFMDSDVYLSEDFISSLSGVLKEFPNIYAFSPKILKAGSGKIFSCGIRISSIYRAYDLGADRPSNQLSKPFFIDGPSSCCAIFKRDCLEKLKDKNGYFDKEFFFLFEDVDLALRMKKRNYKSMAIPTLLCYHYGNSSNTSYQLRRYLCLRNRLFMILKNNKKSRLISIFLKSLIYDIPRTVHFSFTNRYAPRLFRDIYRYR